MPPRTFPDAIRNLVDEFPGNSKIIRVIADAIDRSVDLDGPPTDDPYTAALRAVFREMLIASRIA